MACLTVIPQRIQQVQDSYSSDPLAQELLTKLSLDSAAVPYYTLTNGLLRYKNKLWVGHSPTLHQQLISALHYSAIGGHSGTQSHTGE
jgi:hypothetical protein